MANCSDAYGTITVEKVGKEFLEFLEDVQGKDTQAYYKLAEPEDWDGVVPDTKGHISFNFSTMGRWNYGANLAGYLDGQWLNGEGEKEAYAKFIEALEIKDGSVTVEYTDSDSAMDWMGTGVASIHVVDGAAQYAEHFDEEPLDVSKYAEQNGMSVYEAFSVLHGDEPADAWGKYVKQCMEKGEVPKDPQQWYDEDFEWED